MLESANAEIPVNNSVPENNYIGEAYGEANEKLITFIQENLKIMQGHLMKERFPNLQSLNQAYMDYTPTLFSLNSLYQKVKFNADKAQKELDDFEDQALIVVKEELNRDDNKKTWYSATELQAKAHTTFKAQFAKLHAKVALAEGRRSFVERLCKSWDAWQFGLGQISRNLIAEANATGIDMKAQKVMPVDPYDDAVETVTAQALNNAVYGK